MAKDTILNRQPLKTLYLAYFVSSFMVKVPYWSVRYALPALRPRLSWSWKRAVIIRAIQEVFSCKVDAGTGKARDPTIAIPDTSLTDAKFVWVEGVDDSLYCSEIRRLGDITGARPTKIAGYWLLKKRATWDGPKAKPGEKTVLHLHGGAFYIGTANPSDVTANFTRGLLQFSSSLERVFAIDYRLTSSAPNPPTNPFPAALLDSLAGYRYLVQEAGFAPENIVIAGDSAGANLVVGLVRHLIENPVPGLPPPGRILTVSGWFDLSMSRMGPGSSNVVNSPIDIFGPIKSGHIFGEYGVESLRGQLDFEVVKTNRYLSPSSSDCQPMEGRGLYQDFPQAYVVAGGSERALDESTAMIRSMKADGVKVIEDIPPDAVHDFIIFTWHEPERTEVLKRVNKWIDAK